MYMQERLEKIFASRGDDEFFELFGGIYEILKNFELTMLVLESEAWANFYNDINSYSELATELIYDEVLWENVDTDEDEVFQFISSHEDEEEILKEFLFDSGWRISPTGLGICLSLEDFDNEERMNSRLGNTEWQDVIKKYKESVM